MRAHPFLVVLTCVLSLALGSCNTGKGVSNGSTHGTLRLINVIPNAGGPLNVTFDLKPFATDLPFEGMTQYQTIDVGLREVQVSVAGSSTNVIDVTPIFLPDTAYTFVAFGALANASGMILNDTLIFDPGAGMFALRVINGASNNGGVDVYVTAPGEDLNTVSPSIAGVGYGTTSLFVNLPVGNREVRVTAANTKQVIYDTPAQTFAERAQVEAIVYSRGSSTLVNVAFLNIDDTGTGSIANSSLARFKVINGSSVGSPLNVFVDQDLALSNIPYAAASSYQTINAGQRVLTVEPTATPGAALLTLDADVSAGERHGDRDHRHGRRVDRDAVQRTQLPAGAGPRPRALRQQHDGRCGARCVRQLQPAGLRAGDEHRLGRYRARCRRDSGNRLRVRLQCQRIEPDQPAASRGGAARRTAVHDLRGRIGRRARRRRRPG